jgi:hypothetical protein
MRRANSSSVRIEGRPTTGVGVGNGVGAVGAEAVDGTEAVGGTAGVDGSRGGELDRLTVEGDVQPATGTAPSTVNARNRRRRTPQ